MKVNRFWPRWTIFLLVIAILLAGAGPVSADSNPIYYTTGGRQQFVAPDGQVFWVEEFTIVSTLTKPQISATGCKSITHGIDMYNALGGKVWRYAWKIDWCYNGSKVTSLNPREIVNIYYPGYSFKGSTRTTRGGVNQWNYYHLTRGDICYIDYGANCAWHTYPTIEQDVNGAGGYYGNAWH